MANWLRRKFDALSTEIIGGLMVAAILTLFALGIGAVAWAITLSWDGPSIIALVVGLLIAAIFAINQSLQLSARLRQPTALTPENAEAILQSWALQYGYAIRNIQNPASFFQFAVTAGGSEVIVTRSQAEPEFISVGIILNITPMDQGRLDAITETEGSALILELRAEFARLGAEYEGIEHPLRQIYLGDKAMLDTLDKLMFMRRIMFIRRARALLEILITLAVEDVERAVKAKSSTKGSTAKTKRH